MYPSWGLFILQTAWLICYIHLSLYTEYRRPFMCGQLNMEFMQSVGKFREPWRAK